MILTWADVLAEVKLECMINDTSDDIWLTSAANEILAELAASGDHLRDFRLNIELTVNINASEDFEDHYIANIEQVYYQRNLLGVAQQRWSLTENNAPICPAPVAGYPASYIVHESGLNSGVKRYTFTWGPRNTGHPGDNWQIVFIGFRYVATATELPFPSAIPFLKRSLMERLRIRRNVDPNRVIPLEPLITRAATAAMNTQDTGDTVADDNTPNKNESRRS